MQWITAFWLSLICIHSLNGCASGPTFDTTAVDRTLTPLQVATAAGGMTGQQVLWGGSILGISNLPDLTRIEMMAYPLDSREKPQYDDMPTGPFIAEKTGFLDPAIYTEGRLLTLRGTVTRIDTIDVGGTQQARPVIDMQEFLLWRRESHLDTSSIHFGLGLSFGF
jgi:outer membrane lipoprotein